MLKTLRNKNLKEVLKESTAYRVFSVVGKTTENC